MDGRVDRTAAPHSGLPSRCQAVARTMLPRPGPSGGAKESLCTGVFGRRYRARRAGSGAGSGRVPGARCREGATVVYEGRFAAPLGPSRSLARRLGGGGRRRTAAGVRQLPGAPLRAIASFRRETPVRRFSAKICDGHRGWPDTGRPPAAPPPGPADQPPALRPVRPRTPHTPRAEHPTYLAPSGRTPHAPRTERPGAPRIPYRTAGRPPDRHSQADALQAESTGPSRTCDSPGGGTRPPDRTATRGE